jgi:Lhr-like helicases
LHACRSTLEDPQEGEVDAVFATSSLELGIDVGKINAVIQYMSPRQVTRLIQRVGRSGHRMGSKSLGFIVPGDNVFDALECLGTELEFVIMVIAVSCVKLLSAHNSTQHTSRKHKV